MTASRPRLGHQHRRGVLRSLQCGRDGLRDLGLLRRGPEVRQRATQRHFEERRHARLLPEPSSRLGHLGTVLGARIVFSVANPYGKLLGPRIGPQEWHSWGPES